MSVFSRIQDKLKPPYIIAEAGINHNGDLDTAKKMVIAAAKAGADAIKFQTHLPDFEMLKDDVTADYVGESLYDLLSRVALSKEEHLELKNISEENNIDFLSTPFSKEAVDLLEELQCPLYKVGSGEATNIPLLQYIAKKNKPMIVSTGMTSLDEIQKSVEAITKINKQLVLLHCTSTYPTQYKDVRLKVIDVLKAEFPDLCVGLSDHSQGIYTALGAVSFGVRVIEKHFTCDRNWPGPDQKASIEPMELEMLVNGSRAIFEALQNDAKVVLDDEVNVQKMARESIVSLVDIAKGEIFSTKNIWVKRPGTGIPASELEHVLGKTAVRPIDSGSLLAYEDF